MPSAHAHALGSQQLRLLLLPAGREPARRGDHAMGGDAAARAGERPAPCASALRTAQPVRDTAIAGDAAGWDGAHERGHLLLEGRRRLDHPESGRDLHAAMVESEMTPRSGGRSYTPAMSDR